LASFPHLHLSLSLSFCYPPGLGGLALLADHLPLLYPEITQHNKPSATNQQSENGSDLSDQDYEFVTQVKGITIGGVPVSQFGISGLHNMLQVAFIPLPKMFRLSVNSPSTLLESN